ncbi:phosphate transport system permease protein PstA [Halarchaeum acidiphilum MH1-52-1]|uniref:Phosphate transport system permease protein PstA n=1 Tax=Halarchaeum acidiphilum MH1-52-1 TaxID=1261545 RepID=U2YUI5_9EURY|nr:phosphate ABC transporter permease PstA [Halarchaeum acidiphilum]GAD52402.1 phosphate transport system permease protein PstA [Halarchaeum acidiphilum MH1-52-1]
MSASHASSATIEDDRSGVARSAATTAVGLSVLTMLLAVANVLNWITTDASVASVALSTLYGVALAVAGVVTVAVGLLSASAVIDANANDTSGVLSGLPVGLLALSVVGLVASQTLGYGVAIWAPAALVCAVAAFLFGSLAREDLTATLPWGGFALFVAAVLLAGVITPSWTWDPRHLGVALTGTITVPCLAFAASLATAWAAAKATQGFGARGRQAGAYLLIGANALFMLSLLVLLVAFVVEKGAGHALRGIHLGPGLSVHVPFVMNGAGLGYDIDGVFPAIVGTFWLVFGALVFAVPLGVGAAVFLAEYAERGRFTTVVDIATDGLWSTPSIVYGLFGYAFILPRLSPGGRPNVLAGMLVLGFMLIPLVLITSREAIDSVPDAYRDASVALGVGRWETIRSVVLPAAVPGVITGIILGVGRIAGETAPIILVAAGGLNADPIRVIHGFRFTSSPPFVANDALLSATNALPYQVYAVIETGVGGSESFGWASAFVLLLVVLCFYAVGIATRMYFQRKLER